MYSSRSCKHNYATNSYSEAMHKIFTSRPIFILTIQIKYAVKSSLSSLRFESLALETTYLNKTQI